VKFVPGTLLGNAAGIRFVPPGCVVGQGSGLCYRCVAFWEEPLEAVGKLAIHHHLTGLRLGYFFEDEGQAQTFIRQAARVADWNMVSLDNRPGPAVIERLNKIVGRKAVRGA